MGCGVLAKGFRLTPRCFWKTVRHLRRSKWGTIQVMSKKDGTLLTLTVEIIRLWKEKFEELVILTNPPFMIKTDLDLVLKCKPKCLCFYRPRPTTGTSRRNRNFSCREILSLLCFLPILSLPSSSQTNVLSCNISVLSQMHNSYITLVGGEVKAQSLLGQV